MKKNPHRVFQSGTVKTLYGGDLFETADTEMEILQVISQTDHVFEVNLPDLKAMERTSNGSFIFDESIEGGVKVATIK